MSLFATSTPAGRSSNTGFFDRCRFFTKRFPSFDHAPDIIGAELIETATPSAVDNGLSVQRNLLRREAGFHRIDEVDEGAKRVWNPLGYLTLTMLIQAHEDCGCGCAGELTVRQWCTLARFRVDSGKVVGHNGADVVQPFYLCDGAERLWMQRDSDHCTDDVRPALQLPFLVRELIREGE
eukprot:CAMPEP_0114498002 /NCGR_PEP_ID=MMETSP0109-20121206/6638_1 /TAXON_ID=29199 /ORGANISM="Chlorarachnion reptans, Strain CCCM449" /LENGTH=179 /DNA_ID=CAMNT_0001675447 /DNA_START=202 /DNA_END=740 /DNA_ORIENTATION=-